MNTAELTALLGRIQVLDNRQVDELTLQAWEPLLAKVDYEDAVAAVNAHFTSSDKYLLPVHIVSGAKITSSARIRRQSIVAAKRIVELGGKAPVFWDGAQRHGQDLALVGKLIEAGDPSADTEAQKIIDMQREEQAGIEAGRQWMEKNL